MSRPLVAGVLAGALLLVPTTALAHPAFNPNAGPDGEPIASTLVVPHGCAPGGEMPDGDAETISPTVLLSLQVRDGVTIQPGDVDGWGTAVTDAEVTWTDAGGATTDVIELPVTVTVSGEPGDPLYVRAYQECESGDSFQWIGTPDDDARWPAVYLQVSDGVGNEAPPADATGDMEMGDTAATEHDDMAVGGDATDDETTTSVGGTAAATTDETAADGATDEDAADGDAASTTDDGAGGGPPTGVVVGVLALIAVAAAALVLRGRWSTPPG